MRVWPVLLVIAISLAVVIYSMPEWHGVMPGFGVH